MNLLEELIYEELRGLEEVGRTRKALAALATAGMMATSAPASGETTTIPGTHMKRDERTDVPPERLSSRKVTSMVRYASKRYGVDPALVYAMVKTESNFNPAARSHAGAIGMMQLMPKTAKWLDVEDPYDPFQNILGGTRYLRYLLKLFDGEVELAIAAYNAGPHRVKQHGGIPPYEETQKYVKRVLERMETAPF